MEQFRTIQEIVLILGITFVTSYFFIKFKKPPILGYLFAGIILGTSFFSKYINLENTAFLAEVGVALLLFTTGVEFSFDAISRMKKIALVGGILQITLTTFILYFIFAFIGYSSYESFFLGSVFSLSSTAIIVKLLEEKKELQTRQGEISLSWLIIQDLAVVFIIIFLKLLGSGDNIGPSEIIAAFGKSIVLITASISLGKFILPGVFEAISRLDSEELLLIVSLFVCILLSVITEKLGLSYTLGAFLGGLMLSQSFLNHQIVSEIKPIRNLFSLLFFVSIGTLFSIPFLFSSIIKIIIVVVIVLLTKFIIIGFISLILGRHSKTSFKVAANLTQIGEFAFVISMIGKDSLWISNNLYSIVVASTVLTMIITPFLINNSESLYNIFRENVRKKSLKVYRFLFVRFESKIEIDQPGVKDHVVICGYGRVGNYVGRVLNKFNIPFIVIESNTETFELYKGKVNIIYGDATNIDILDKADVERAKILIVALPGSVSVDLVTNQAKKLNQKLKIITRTHVPKQIDRLKSLGVSEVIEPEFEAAIEISKRAMKHLGKTTRNVETYLKRSRAQLL